MESGDDSLDNLPSSKFYRELKKGSIPPNNNDQAYWDFIIKSFPENSSIYKISDILLKGFYYVSYMNNNDDFYQDRWNYLYFWVWDIVHENFVESSLFPNIMYIINSVKKKFDNDKIYDFDLSDTELDEFTLLKVLFDYFQNYESIKTEIASNKSECSLMYKLHIENSSSNYNILTKRCQKEQTSYCKFFRYIETTYKPQNYVKLKCDRLKISKSHDLRKHMEDLRQGTLHGHDSEGTINAHLVHTGETQKFSFSSNILSIAFPILGISLIFFIFYKFTPFGSLLHSSRLKKKTTQHNLDKEQTEELLNNTYSEENVNSTTIQHRLPYHILNM
ncbi:Plasmodium vivax Vir protein, putative [Plasmodium ovale]|uniref:Plasmodium vivax Vir protein, putative n=1 Tax=Plasmodium ovale TaxID=36330 RepID=A0A1C3KHW4_PLAOA|nr:Plasmodium vivax Vir protein, putative [Plasmodium ovale]